MNSLLSLAYRAAGGLATLATLATRVAPQGEGKLLRALVARRDIAARFAAWGRDGRDRTRPLLWMHAPSVGEGLQARPVLELMRARRPDVQLAYTFFSPSAEPLARSLAVDFSDYLPFDTAVGARIALDALQPTALVYAKLDVWPTLTGEARRRGVRLGLISGTVSPESSRGGAVARALLHDAYAALDAVGAVSSDDAARLIALGAVASRVRETGDTRYDQVAARARGVDRRSPLLMPLRASPSASDTALTARPTVVAGSTWPADERVLLPAWEAVRRAVVGGRLIIAPHEPTPTHLQAIEQWGRTHGIALTRLGAPGQEHAEVVLVDRVGVLGELYALATVAFVGGGFHDAGLHSVLEPAAFGAPVLFGPRFMNARDAAQLQSCGGGVSIARIDDAIDVLSRWLIDPAARERAGRKARAMVEAGAGAAERSFFLVDALLG